VRCPWEERKNRTDEFISGSLGEKHRDRFIYVSKNKQKNNQKSLEATKKCEATRI
jgi:hypothetical protein